MPKESTILQKIFRFIGSRMDTRIFRNNIGIAWRKDGTPIKFGVCNPGGSDLIGWKVVKITKNMIGKSIAVFVAIEIKQEKKEPTPKQWNFIYQVNTCGGLAGVAYSEKDAEEILNKKPGT